MKLAVSSRLGDLNGHTVDEILPHSLVVALSCPFIMISDTCHTYSPHVTPAELKGPPPGADHCWNDVDAKIRLKWYRSGHVLLLDAVYIT